MRKNIILFLGLAFSIQMANASVTDSTRAVAVKGATNFRDLGGYETGEGRRLRWGKVFRSDHLSRLTDRDIAFLQRMKIQCVCDFRTSAIRNITILANWRLQNANSPASLLEKSQSSQKRGIHNMPKTRPFLNSTNDV